MSRHKTANFIKFKSPSYNWVFNASTGDFARWGNSIPHNPDYSPVGPELLDIEVSTVCSQGCSHCYKSNTTTGKNMSLKTFKSILDNTPENLTQVAFGVGDIDANKELFAMFSYCRFKNVIPNITINGSRLTDRIVDKLVRYCGAVAVSNYDKDICYSAVERLINAGLAQVNIHQLLSKDTLDQCYEVVSDTKSDNRLSKLTAIVFLTLKPKGDRNSYKSVTRKEYFDFIKYVEASGVNFGFDSCAANNFKEAVNNSKYDQFIEPCESCLFSSYINVEGKFFPCSFAEGEKGFEDVSVFEGINVVDTPDYIKDIWYADSTKFFRSNLLNRKRNCPIFNLDLV